MNDEGALGIVSTRSFPAVVGTADMMLKTASVHLVGYEKTGDGYCSAVVRGSFAEVRLAVDKGAETAQEFGQLISQVVIPRPLPNLEAVLPISKRLQRLAQSQGRSRLRDQAVGLLETRGFPAMVGAADAMLKSADVQLAAYETTGAGLCTIIIRGKIADVVMAADVGILEAERIGEFHAVMIIPRPLADLEDTLPTADIWLEQPLAMPVQIAQVERAEVELPDLGALTPQKLPLDI